MPETTWTSWEHDKYEPNVFVRFRSAEDGSRIAGYLGLRELREYEDKAQRVERLEEAINTERKRQCPNCAKGYALLRPSVHKCGASECNGDGHRCFASWVLMDALALEDAREPAKEE